MLFRSLLPLCGLPSISFLTKWTSQAVISKFPSQNQISINPPPRSAVCLLLPLNFLCSLCIWLSLLMHHSSSFSSCYQYLPFMIIFSSTQTPPLLLLLPLSVTLRVSSSSLFCPFLFFFAHLSSLSLFLSFSTTHNQFNKFYWCKCHKNLS